MKQDNIRMSPKFVSTMMFFKDYLEKKKLSPVRINPNLVKIFGKSNADREFIISQANKPQYVKYFTRKDSDERVLKKIDIEFQKEIAIKSKIKVLDQEQQERIRASVHQQVVNSDSSSFVKVIRKNFSSHLSPEHFQLMKTFKQELTFKEKLKIKEPLEFARYVLQEKTEREKVYKKQLLHDKKFEDPEISRFPQLDLEKINYAQKVSQPNTSRSASTNNNKVMTINNQCLTERKHYHKILRRFKNEQKKVFNKYKNIQEECQMFLH